MFAGLILCWFGLRRMGASYAVTRWPVVPARIVHSSVDSVSSGRFRPRIEYEFFLAGRRYVGAGIDQPGTPNDLSASAIPLDRAETIVASYPVGQELLAGYDPVNPSRTVLRPRFNWWTLAPALAGALFVSLGMVIWRQHRRATGTVTP